MCGRYISLSVGNVCLYVFKLCGDVWEMYVDSVRVWVALSMQVCWKGCVPFGACARVHTMAD